MKIAIVGYGKMGQLIAAIAQQRQHTVVIVDPKHSSANYRSASELSPGEVDCAIEFTIPSQVIDNITTLSARGIAQVIGTTGWYDRMPIVKEIVDSSGVGLIYAANFSLGVNAFMRIVGCAAELINLLPEYDVSGVEWHHNRKADSPSGTALKLAEVLLDKIDRKTELLAENCNREIKPQELHFPSIRCGQIPGTHEIVFDSTADTISLKHTARSREGFALGAVVAAEWINNRKGFFEITALIDDLLGKRS